MHRTGSSTPEMDDSLPSGEGCGLSLVGIIQLSTS